ncbi:MAG: Spy/CpxP family protein refolding chaperone [Bryobacteraceae bacterium]
MKQAILILAAGAASIAFAQPPGPQNGPRPVPVLDEVKAYLQLTDAQVQSLQQMQQTVRESNQSIAREIGQKRQSLAQQLDSGAASAATVGQLMIDIRALENRIQQSMATARTQAVASLADAQKTRLAALDAAAKLNREIGQARGLNLLAPPENPGPGVGIGPAFGPGRGPGAPAGFGPRPSRRSPPPVE